MTTRRRKSLFMEIVQYMEAAIAEVPINAHYPKESKADVQYALKSALGQIRSLRTIMKIKSRK